MTACAITAYGDCRAAPLAVSTGVAMDYDRGERKHVFNWRLPNRSARQDLVDGLLEFPPFGQVLHVRRPAASALLKRDAVAASLGRFADGKMPFAGIVLDLRGGEYYFSSADLGAVVGSISAWSRGRVAPCAIVLSGKPATQLQTLLDITKLNTIQHLRIVDSLDAGRKHVEAFLAQQRPPS